MSFHNIGPDTYCGDGCLSFGTVRCDELSRAGEKPETGESSTAGLAVQTVPLLRGTAGGSPDTLESEGRHLPDGPALVRGWVLLLRPGVLGGE